MLALDDFAGHEAAFEPLLPLVDVIKVDLHHVRRRALAETTRRLRRWPARLLAEKLGTEEEVHHCRALGYDLFQGYYLGRPRLLTSARAPSPSPPTGSSTCAACPVKGARFFCGAARGIR
jgi:EAL and modified HD-GYP domain-containing signal transduction protein